MNFSSFDNTTIMSFFTTRPEPVSDEAIEALFISDRSMALKCLYEKYWAVLLEYTRKKMPNTPDAEEVLQDILINIYAAGIRFHSSGKLLAYLKRCIHNRVINYYRKNSIYDWHIRIHEMNTATEHDPVTGMTDLKDLQACLNQVLLKLNAECRTVFDLSRKGHFSKREISHLLQRPYSTVEKQLKRALTQVKQELLRHPDYARMLS